MSDTPPDDGPGWPAAASDLPSPRDGVPTAGPTSGGRPPALLAALGGVVVLAVVAIVMVVTSGGGDGNGPSAAGVGVGGAVAPTGTSAPSNVGTVAPTTTEGEGPDQPGGGDEPSAGTDLPDVTIPGEVAPPTTIPGSEPNSIPTDIFSDEEAPQWGTLVVDLEEGGYEDFAVHLREDQELQLLSMADDGIETEISVYAPDGSFEGWWAGGEPGVVNGLEWYLPEEPLPATGTYVIRVIHTGGSHEPFALGFFGNP